MKMQTNTALNRHNEHHEGLLTSSRSPYDYPITSINHNRQPPSPSSFSKEGIYQKDSHRQLVDSAFPSSHQETVHQLCLLSLPMETEGKMPLTSKPASIITPNPSFGERGESSMDCLPDYLPNGAQHQQWEVKKSSVGLPSAYPGHGRHSSLAEAVMEELQDFDYFESSCCSNTMQVEASASSIEESPSRRSVLMSATQVSDPDLDAGLSPVARREEAKTAPLRGRHRRARNHSMSQDFFDHVLKDL